MRDKEGKQDIGSKIPKPKLQEPNWLYDDTTPTTGDYWNASKIVMFLFIGCIGIGSMVYVWTRYVGSNQRRELLVNSGEREAAAVINLPKRITACETAITSLERLEFDRDQYAEGSEAWRMAQDGVLGTKVSIEQCSGDIQDILDTTEIESTPQWPALQKRIEKINEKL